MNTHEVLHIIRNPLGWSEEEVRAARLAAADLVEQQAKQIERQAKEIGSLTGALEQQQARFVRIKPAWEMLAKKVGRFTADPLDERLILEEAASEIEQQAKEIEALKADAMRYRFLRDNGHLNQWWSVSGPSDRCENIDADIDAAMTGQ